MDSGSLKEKKTASWFFCSPFRACVALYRCKLITVEPLIFLFMLAKHLYTPLYEQYYYVSYGSQILRNTTFPFPNGSFCLNSSEVDRYAGNGSFKTVEAWSNNLVVYGQIASRIPAMIVTVLLGPLSDRFGRKPLMFIGTVGTTLGAFVSLLIVHFQWNPYYFIVANFISGVTGDFATILSGSFAYVADVSSEKWRGLRIGIIEGVMSIGSAVGPTLVGYWLQWNNCDFILPLWLYTACIMAAGLYVLFCIPESLSKTERKELTAGNPKGLKSMLHGFGIFLGFSPQYSLWKLWAANFVACLLVFNVLGSYLVTVYFLKSPPFDVDAQKVGLYQGVYYVSRTLSNTVLMVVFSAMKMPEAAIALTAVAFNSGCNLLLGFSRKVYQVYAVASFQGVESLTWTALRTLMSKLVEQRDQGAMFAILSSGEALAGLLSSVTWPNVYNVVIGHNLRAGVTFMIMAGVALVAVPFLIALLIYRKRQYLVMEEVDNEKPSDSQNPHSTEKDHLLHSNGVNPHDYSTNSQVSINV